jgi:mannosyltransferase OCH1-like enzyme
MYQFYNAAMEWMVVLNDGSEDQALTARKGLPELIPRKIHQIWIHGTIPAFKQFLMKRLRDSHPDYEYFLWSKDNFTRENFP